MSNSTIKLYSVAFRQIENARVDDLEQYLLTVPRDTISDFQYIRNDLDISIKIDYTQEMVDSFPYNYCSITTESEKFYYYILSAKQISPKTIQLDLHMDTINSLTDPRDFTWKTEISRQHMDRFIKTSEWTPQIRIGALVRLIDREAEGLTLPVFKTSDVTIQDKDYGDDDLDWYLIYRKVTRETTGEPLTYFEIEMRASTDIYYFWPYAGERRIVGGINEVDRRDENISKIIKLPYCPVEYSKSTLSGFEGQYVFPSAFSFGCDQYPIPTPTARGYVTIPYTYEFEHLRCAEIDYTDETYAVITSVPTYKDSKKMDYESKLYNSAYHSTKLVYDSFTQEIKDELLGKVASPSWYTNQVYNRTKIPIDFKATNTVNSKLAFKTDFSAYGTRYEESDFENYLLSTRNSELTLLSDSYLNYLKTGYNYDKKANALQIEQANRSAVTSLAGSGLGLLASSVGAILGGPTIKAASIAGLGASLASGLASGASSIKNVQDTIERTNNQMQSKLAQLAAQSASTSGTDDVDLFSWYTGNRLHYMKYEPTARDKSNLYLLFDLTGYSHHVTDVPNVDSRIWYNYIQCNPKLPSNVEAGMSRLKTAWLDDLKEKYNQGVTVFHNQTIDSIKTWNFDRNYENWETWVVEGVTA